MRKNSSCVSDYIPQSVSEEVEVCTTSSSEHRSHTEIPSYNTDVVSVACALMCITVMKTGFNVAVAGGFMKNAPSVRHQYISSNIEE